MRVIHKNGTYDVPLEQRVLPPTLDEVQVMADICLDKGIRVTVTNDAGRHRVVSPPTWRAYANSKDKTKPHVYHALSEDLVEMEDVDYNSLQIAIHEWIVGWNTICPAMATDQAYLTRNANSIRQLSSWFQAHRRRYIMREALSKKEIYEVSDIDRVVGLVRNCLYSPTEQWTNLAHRIDAIAPWKLQ